MKSKTHLLLMVCLSISTVSSNSFAYGGGGGGSSCSEVSFSEESPSRDSVVPSLDKFSIVASKNADLGSLVMRVNGDQVTPVISPKRSGDFQLETIFAAPITTPGRVRITLKAMSKDGCDSFQPIYIEVKP